MVVSTKVTSGVHPTRSRHYNATNRHLAALVTDYSPLRQTDMVGL